MVGLVLAYGAAVVSMGLLTATWQGRPGRAIALSVAAFMAVALVWPIVVLMIWAFDLPSSFALIGVSPFMGAFFTPLILLQGSPSPMNPGISGAWCCWPARRRWRRSCWP